MNLRSLIFALVFAPIFAFSQQTVNGSVMHDGLDRKYIMYIPASYTGDEPVPLLFNFHGFTSNATQQMFYGNFQPIADREGFIIVHPEGTIFNGNTHFNVGGFTAGSTVDDVGFTEAMIDKFSDEMNIDSKRIYSTGMSNGGFMSFLLACQLSDKIAAVASVTGSMTPEIFNNCDAQHQTPVLQIHGTIDRTVPYNGAIWSKSIDEVIEYWVNFNNCETVSTQTDIPDTNPSDGSTAEHFVYANGDAGATTEHIKITGGQHTWPGAFLNFPGTNLDFNASDEVWKFFDRYDIDGLRTSSGAEDLKEEIELEIFPNPTSSNIYLKFKSVRKADFQLLNLTGQPVLRGAINSDFHSIEMTHLPEGVYFLKIGEKTKKVLKVE